MPDAQLPHRDDLPMDVVEHLLSKIQNQYGPTRVIFAGDSNAKIRKKALTDVEKLNRRIKTSFVNGKCMECNKPVGAEWPPDKNDKNWLPNGWELYNTIGSKDQWFLVCNDCENK